jgi:hypothetical protein
MGNTMLLDILAPMDKTRNIVYKKTFAIMNKTLASLLTKLADLQTLNTLGISSLRVTAMVTRSLK